MSDAFHDFDVRLKRIDRNHARMARGYSGRMTKDGLIVFRPKRRQVGFPVRGLFLLVVGFICFKGLIIAHLGAATFEQRAAALGEGTYVEQAGAVIMQPDPVSSGIAAKLSPYFR